MYIDESVYPDLDAPTELHSPGDRADYVQRICAAWDFGLVPERATFQLFRGWEYIFDQFSLPHSPAYHAFRAWFGWSATERGFLVELVSERLDQREGREDPCALLL